MSEFPKFPCSPIGFIGLGIMGKGMLSNLISKLDSKTKYIIWNRNSKVCEEVKLKFQQMNIEIAKTPREVVDKCNVTFSMLSNLEASIAVVSNLNLKV